MLQNRHWGLGVKLLLVGAPFMALALLAVTLTLWVSWQLDGGAAATNEAGRLRMQAWRIAASVHGHDEAALQRQAAGFEQSLALLRDGDAARPLFVPWDTQVTAHFAQVENAWSDYRSRWLEQRGAGGGGLDEATAGFVARIDSLVTAIEAHMSRWTALLHLCQLGMMFLALAGCTLLAYAGYRFVLQPLGQLKDGIRRLQDGDLDARVVPRSRDEFGALAEGFNQMAAHLQSMYRDLESRVVEKTAELEEKRERLESLYEVSALVARAGTLDELAQGFAQCIRRIAHADATALRWTDQSQQRYMMLAADGLPEAVATAEHCIVAGDCHCGSAQPQIPVRVIPIHREVAGALPCSLAGFATLVSVPVHLHERHMGEVDLFFHQKLKLSEAERSLLQTLASHLAGAMENLRLNAMEKEAAVAQERTLLARELHDSIAQSLAFLKIQVQLMQDALSRDDLQQAQVVLDEINTGVRESYADVRELLLHFRTRANAEDIEQALLTTLRKFEHQSGVRAQLAMHGQGLPLSGEVQLQVLHIVQEALSNVRKHARAGKVWLDVHCQPAWRFEVRDDGIGFDVSHGAVDETHVGLRIMHERAQRIGAQLEIVSTPQRGTSVLLTLALPARPGPLIEPADTTGSARGTAVVT